MENDYLGDVSASSAYGSGTNVGQSIAQGMGAAKGANGAASMFGAGSSSFSEFSAGFQAGYQGVSMTLGPLLAYRQAKNERAIWQCKADSAKLMRQMYTDAAESVLSAGQKQYAALSYQAGQGKSSKRTAMAANGVRVGVGSSAEYLASHDIAARVNLQQIRVDALNAAWGYRYKAVEAQNKALSYESAKKSVSPIAAAISMAVNQATESMPSLSSMFGGGDSGGGSSASGAGSSPSGSSSPDTSYLFNGLLST